MRELGEKRVNIEDAVFSKLNGSGKGKIYRPVVSRSGTSKDCFTFMLETVEINSLSTSTPSRS